ncbi:MAG: hypothetical protein COW00_18900 [Bdellovibrio sp. CG12_big_fil_rev_8_21_14_0_65_39_13]|nr:MAG: hypothetical protein COW78_05970 [Bdellovibrio sp. CG22_combo_CG10-13_8_21_14_all_39_27]PIQ57767.1 MAG: hypothetical protein COW00_18900 [Bdellovibrio sp. CG12_big_fil_rev_8_21_14_0_65_39_13]PIR34998.1 MAG: hypothetical protein COV37_10995 [Bdellovibrio sp. CG11_big_fil_rev_8_21_14_0_20_39_38]
MNIRKILILISLISANSFCSELTKENILTQNIVRQMEELQFSSGGPRFEEQLISCTVLDQPKTKCLLRDIFLENSHSLPSNEEMIILPDHTAMMNPLFSGVATPKLAGEGERERIARMMKNVRGRKQADVFQDFENIRNIFIKTITKGRSENELSQTERIIINRIKGTILKIDSNQCRSAWASNQTMSQTISLCETALKLPKYSLIALLSHEMSHSFDFCNSRHTCYGKVEGQELSTHFFDNTGLDAEELKMYKHSVSVFFNSDSKRGIISPLEGFGDKQIQHFENLTQRGIIREIDPGIPFKDHPYTQIAQCLHQNFPKNYKEIPLARKDVCSGSNFKELGAQIGGAQALAQFIQEQPPTNSLEKLSIMTLSSPLNFEGKYKNSLTNKEMDFNSIYLSRPSLQQLYNCSPQAQQNCE